MSEALEEGKC